MAGPYASQASLRGLLHSHKESFIQFRESYAREKVARSSKKIAYGGLAGEKRPCHNRGRPVGIYRKILWLSFALANLQSISSARFIVMNI